MFLSSPRIPASGTPLIPMILNLLLMLRPFYSALTHCSLYRTRFVIYMRHPPDLCQFLHLYIVRPLLIPPLKSIDVDKFVY